jgi:hypothetical protein
MTGDQSNDEGTPTGEPAARSWAADGEPSVEMSHEWLGSVTEHHRGPGTVTVSDGADNMAAGMVHITPTGTDLELAFMERDWPPLVCRLLPRHVRGLVTSVREAQMTEAPQRPRYGRVEDHWSGARAAPVRPRDGSVILECRFESAGQRVWLPASEVDRLLEVLERE